MGQEHISYILGYSSQIQIDYLCDPFEQSLERAKKIMIELSGDPLVENHGPFVLTDEKELLLHIDSIDLLVIASPNYLHTPSLLKWGLHDLTILVEKPLAISREQHDELRALSSSNEWKARIWVAMEYRYIPAITKLLSLIPEIGDLKMVTIRENRYPFLHKVGKWNRDREKTGDTLVEKCCHFFDLFRLITQKEAILPKIKTLAQRGLNYQDEPSEYKIPIIDSAYVTMPFKNHACDKNGPNAIGCLELCMFSEGSRHQEEIIVTGTKGRLEAYLPENKVYQFCRPSHERWSDRTIPPPPSSIHHQVFDCSNVREIHSIEGEIPTHRGYHYCSTAIEWYHLLNEIKRYEKTREFFPHVSLDDGLRAVEIGIEATAKLADDLDE
jgi:myo-inositol 2-dehydrogenase/D-chiro-inositol 1-dehydrogenase